MEQKLAVAAGAYYMGSSLDQTRFWVYAVPAQGITLEALDQAMDRVIAAVVASGVSADHLERAKTQLVADAIYAQDNQSSLGRWYGAALTTGMSVQDVREWPERIEAVSMANLQAAAKTWLDRRRAVTGHLLQAEPAAAA